MKIAFQVVIVHITRCLFLYFVELKFDKKPHIREAEFTIEVEVVNDINTDEKKSDSTKLLIKRLNFSSFV